MKEKEKKADCAIIADQIWNIYLEISELGKEGLRSMMPSIIIFTTIKGDIEAIISYLISLRIYAIGRLCQVLQEIDIPQKEINSLIVELERIKAYPLPGINMKCLNPKQDIDMAIRVLLARIKRG